MWPPSSSSQLVLHPVPRPAYRLTPFTPNGTRTPRPAPPRTRARPVPPRPAHARRRSPSPTPPPSSVRLATPDTFTWCSMSNPCNPHPFTPFIFSAFCSPLFQTSLQHPHPHPTHPTHTGVRTWMELMADGSSGVAVGPLRRLARNTGKKSAKGRRMVWRARRGGQGEGVVGTVCE